MMGTVPLISEKPIHPPPSRLACCRTKRGQHKKSEVKDAKKSEPIFYECKKPGHIKTECSKLKKTEFRKKDSSKKFKRYKKKAMAAAWSNDSSSDSKSSSSEEEEEKANLAFMANTDDKNLSLFKSMVVFGVSGTVGSYSTAFLTAEQQERFAAVKTKLCGNKAVDVADLEKNGMHYVIAAMQRTKWTRMVTISEASYPDLVKAFYTCLKSEEDGSLISSVKVPRSATFSTCTKADSDVMFWAIQNQDINMAEVIIKRMKYASTIIWDTKNKLNVSLPYAHLLTKIFQHYNIDLNGEVSEKMEQVIRSRNLKKSGFSLVASVWTKTSVT
ncbi:hypothetical protein Taro_033741 [Colocasia esculenta]|uniref:CCHC-type domain-containing protein n=1 Tax=Colocasia esculenta TaxID=4460 RepID=A0A843WDD1_COLES|nr:hypothetical protein [Colocasia esculenta]